MFHAVEFIEFIIVRPICAAKVTNNFDISKQIGEKKQNFLLFSPIIRRLWGHPGWLQGPTGLTRWKDAPCPYTKRTVPFVFMLLLQIFPENFATFWAWTYIITLNTLIYRKLTYVGMPYFWGSYLHSSTLLYVRFVTKSLHLADYEPVSRQQRPLEQSVSSVETLCFDGLKHAKAYLCGCDSNV